MKLIYSIAAKIRKIILSYPKYINISDKYVERLALINPGMLHRGNLYCFDYAVGHINSSNPIVEIGAFCGLSTNIINYYLSMANKNNTIYSCDTWSYGYSKPKSLGNFSASEKEIDKYIENMYIQNTDIFSKPKIVHGFKYSSDTFFKHWQKNQITVDTKGNSVKLGGLVSFFYVDGDHSYRQTKIDFENADRYLENGGYIFFDDSAPYSGFECAYLMPEIMKNKKYKLIIRNPNFLFQKIA